MKLTHLAAAAVLTSGLVFAVGAPADAAPKPVKVTMTATMNRTATVTWAANDAEAQNKQTTTWTRTFKRESYTLYEVSVFSTEDGAKVGCSIKLGSKVIRHKTASGDFASVTCMYTKY